MNDDILIPPHDADAERSVLGSLIFMPTAIDEISAMLRVDYFYLVAHQNIYHAILSLHSRHVPAIDPVIVGDELHRKGSLEESGGLHYLFEVLEQTPHASHVRFYASIVQENAMRRAVIYSSREAIQKAYDRSYAITDIASSVVSTIEGVLGQGSEDVRSFADVVSSLRVRQNNPLPPQSTGIRDVDDKLRPFNAPTGGFRPTQLIILGARPAMGKTAYVAGLIEAASDAGIASLLATLEMDGEDIAERIERVDSKRLNELAQRKNIFIEDRKFELEQIIATIRATHKRKQVRFVVIDYLGLIEVDSAIKDSDKLSRITRRMKLLAKELRIPIVLAAQLNRDLEKRDNKRPQLSDIRGSGSIEQDADVVMFLYRHEVYYPDEKTGLAEIIIGKQRNGPVAAIEVGYLKEQTRFVTKAQAPVDVDGFFKDEKPLSGVDYENQGNDKHRTRKVGSGPSP